MRKLLKDKRGVLGLDTVRAFILAILGLAIIAMASLIVMSALDDTSLATPATRNITSNVSSGVASFFENSATYFALLGIVVIMLIIAVVIVAVNRFGGAPAL